MTFHSPTPRPPIGSLPVSSHVALTLRLADPAQDLLVRHVRLLRDCVALAQKRWGFGIEAAVVLPAEVQLLCLFDDVDLGVHGTARLIQSAFLHHVPSGAVPEDQRMIWAEEVEAIRISPAVVALRRTFMENAPVRAGLAKTPMDWPYSSAQRSGGQGSDMGVAVA